MNIDALNAQYLAAVEQHKKERQALDAYQQKNAEYIDTFFILLDTLKHKEQEYLQMQEQEKALMGFVSKMDKA